MAAPGHALWHADAIKKLNIDIEKGKLHKMLREVIAHQVTSKFSDVGKHIVRYSAAWVEDNHLYIQNEYCDGGSIDDLLKRRKWIQQGSVYVRPNGAQMIDAHEQLDIFRHVAEGLRCLHDPHIGLAHLDIKPANIFIKSERSFDVDSLAEVPSGKSKVYKLGDLGLAARINRPSEAEHGDGGYVSQEMMNDVGGTVLTIGGWVGEGGAGRACHACHSRG